MFFRTAGIILAAIGAAGFLMPFWIGIIPGDPSKLEMPLTEISDIAVSEDGDLYFALTFAGRVQKYSSSGKFERSFNVNASGGSFCLEVVDAELAVYIARRDVEERYDLIGNTVRQNIPFSEYVYQEKCEWNERIVDAKSTLRNVAVSLKNAKSTIIIKRQPWHYIAFGPFASWLTFALGLFLIPEWRESVFTYFVRSRERNNDAKPQGAFLKGVNFFLNFIYTLYGLIFTAVGALIILFAAQIEDGKSSIPMGLLGALFVGFSIFWIYKLWTTYDSFIVIAPNIEFEVGPVGFVVWKAFGLLLLAGFLFAVFYFGSNANGAVNVHWQ